MKNLLPVFLLICCSAVAQIPSLLPVDTETNLPDLALNWTASPSQNVIGYALYAVHRNPPSTERTVWASTNAWITNAALYHTDYYVTAMCDGYESLPSNTIHLDNSWMFAAYTIICNGTGNIFQCSKILNPPFWMQTRTNFTGVVLNVTNPTIDQFFLGPGMTCSVNRWNP